jgi:hypothetical protein
VDDEVREDVERLFVWDRLPPYVVRPIYDTDMGRQVVGMAIELEPPWNSALLVQDFLRSEVVCKITEVKEMGAEPLRHFTLMNAHEVMANRDLMLDSLLVHPDFAPLLVKVRKPFFGKTLKVFGHYEVPPGEIFGLAPPPYLGTIPIRHDGVPGVAFHNPNGVLWGHFTPLSDLPGGV